MTRVSILMMLALGSIASAADDPGGWSKAKWGMTDAELLQALPGQAVKLAHVDQFNHARVGIDQVEVAGTQFQVLFAPDDKANCLDRIIFTPSLPTDNSDQVFQSLLDLVVQKYGRPWKSDEGARDTRYQWTFATTVITLQRFVLPTLPGNPRRILLHLIYQRKPDNPL